MNMCLENIGANIRQIRKSKDLTIRELAEESGLNQKYIQGVERARYNISVLNLQKIAEALKVTLTDLVKPFVPPSGFSQ